ncbi:MAG: peptidoglycan-binding domain-containing protein [Ilumatobacteraceae bacterium]
MCRLRWAAAAVVLSAASVGCGDGTDRPSKAGGAPAAVGEVTQPVTESTAEVSDLPVGTTAPVPSTASVTVPPATTPSTPAATVPPAAVVPVVASTLSRGATGDEVIALQAELIARGYQIDMDGEFGPGTEQAVRDEQADMLLPVDGIVGLVTRASLGLGGNGLTNFTTTDAFVAAFLAFLSDGTPGALPADALTALEMWRDSDLAGVTWGDNGTRDEVGGRLVTLLVLGGDGGVFNTLEVCTTPPGRVMWCGVWSASFH